MSFIDDKELKEYRDIMKPPSVDKFEDGFNWKTFAGALFLGFIVNPATDYLSLVVGNDAHIGGAMKWVIVILFAEIAKRSFTNLKSQELYTLHYMAGVALSDPFSGYLWRQYVAQSEYIQGLGLAAELPRWAFPTAMELEAAGRTLLTPAWLPVIALTMFGVVISKVDNYGLGYVLYRMASDVEKLPFPFAPVQAAGIVALSSDERGKEPWRWRCFSIGGVMGVVWGLIYLCVPLITGAILPKRIEIIPIVFIDLTPAVGSILPAVPFNLVLNFGAFLAGMMMPFWGVIGSMIGLLITWIANPILQESGVLSTWRPDMGFVNTQFSNELDFYISFGLGLTLAVTFSKLMVTIGTMLKNTIRPKAKELSHQPSFIQRFREGWKILVTRNRQRGDLSIFVAIFIYLGSTASWIILGSFLVRGYPWKIMIFYAIIYTPLISYATAKLEGICGQAVNFPYLKELTILFSGHKGADIWFAPMPIQNLGQETVGFKVLELTGTKIKSQIKTLILVVPITVVASFVTSEVLWRMAPIPSRAYPFTEQMWPLRLRQWAVMRTATLEGGSQFLEALHPEYALWGFGSGSVLFALLSALGLPVMLIFGAVWGLAQSNPGAIFCTLAGALVGRFYFRRKYKEMWLKYMSVILAGFGCGLGVTTMIAMAFNVVIRMLQSTLW